MKILQNKKIVILLITILLITIYLGIKTTNKPVILEEVKLKENMNNKIKKKKFAIMIENNEGGSYCNNPWNYGAGGSGGGGGLYGGICGFFNGSGGGSGYIASSSLTNKSMYCYSCTESNEESTKTISTTCAEETPTENCAKISNGYAKITWLGI